MSKRVEIYDTTLRDGAQTPGVHLKPEVKAAIASELEKFGVSTIEAGFPASSPEEQEAVARVAQQTRECRVSALARCRPEDIDAAAQALQHAKRPMIHVFMGASDIHLDLKLRMTRGDAIRAVERSVMQACGHGMEVQFCAEDATRADRPFLRQCVETAVQAGASRINVPDTVGCVTPGEYGTMVSDIVRFVGDDTVVSAHCHDDIGMAVANTVAAVSAGARQIEVTVNGIGERAGNCAVETVVAALEAKEIAQTGVDMTQMPALSRMVAERTGVPVQPNHPVVGANAFAHSSGIHQDGLMKDARTYEFISPAVVGVPDHRFVLTAQSGRSAVAWKASRMGRPVSGDALDAIYRAFVEVAQEAEGSVTDSTFESILNDACVPRRPGDAVGMTPAHSGAAFADVSML
ncbi:MAG: 2-isopropylmalate synthase [bacterium]|nr:2-isopropylmalate synthase [bacterium]